MCPRCDYQTVSINDIKRHFARKKPCVDNNGLELTDEIKETVLKNHKYHPPQSNANTIINNYNMMINVINQMEMEEKMGLLMDYQNKNLLDFENDLEEKFEHRVDRLENNKFRAGYFLSCDDLCGIVNDVTKINKNSLEKFNVMFDRVLKRFKLYRCKEWESYLEDIGVKELVSIIKSYYFDTYELYLIRNLHIERETGVNRLKLRDHIDIYYQFIASFDLPPKIQDFSDAEVLGHRLVEGDDHHLANRYLSIYGRHKQALKVAEKSRLQRKIVNIVKENTVHNINELNKTILDFLKVDPVFRQDLLKLRELE